MPETIAFVVPTYDEADRIHEHLDYHARRFDPDELIVVDGGSTDGTRRELRRSNAEVTTIQLSPGNRARQCAEGVRVSDSEVLLFLHADTYLPENFTLDQLRQVDARWGWFDCRMDAEALRYRLLELLISQRSGFFQSPTGDQAIWVYRDLLGEIGGIPRLPLMEDVALSRRLRNREEGHRFRQPVTTSPRRWEENGFLGTVLTMWGLKVAYYLGASPSKLARIYYGRTET
jgi:rSAM/selenodomain-associated transferase 2